MFFQRSCKVAITPSWKDRQCKNSISIKKDPNTTLLMLEGGSGSAHPAVPWHILGTKHNMLCSTDYLTQFFLSLPLQGHIPCLLHPPEGSNRWRQRVSWIWRDQNSFFLFNPHRFSAFSGHLHLFPGSFLPYWELILWFFLFPSLVCTTLGGLSCVCCSAAVFRSLRVKSALLDVQVKVSDMNIKVELKTRKKPTTKSQGEKGEVEWN